MLAIFFSNTKDKQRGKESIPHNWKSRTCPKRNRANELEREGIGLFERNRDKGTRSYMYVNDDYFNKIIEFFLK